MKNFKFFQNKERVFTDWIDALDDYHLGGIPMPTGYIRPINLDLYNRTTLSELSDSVQQVTSDPNFIPADYVQVEIPQTQIQ